eukprot:SAG31_NODE_2789_length_5089_cov_4.516433_3_plen_286_part_00
MLQIKSSDLGQTWGDYRNIQDQIRFPRARSGTGDARNGDCLAPTSGAGVVMRPDQNGRYGGRLVFCAVVNAYQGDVPVFSDDHGRTYNFSKDLSADGPFGVGLDECNIAQAANGSLFLIARNCEFENSLSCGMLQAQAHHPNRASAKSFSPGNHHFRYSRSDDGGEHWTPPRDQEQLLTPVCQGSIISYKGPADKAEALYVATPYTNYSRFNGTILASDDFGDTFSRSLLLWPGHPHSPGMGGGFGYTGLACGLPGIDFDCAVLFDQDAPGLWFTTFSSADVVAH